MATEVLMPRQGNTVESCIILSWKKKEQDGVKQGEVLCEVETDKATFEVEAPSDGTLLKVLHPEGADVPVLELIAVIGEPGEDISELLKQKGSGEQSGGRSNGRDSDASPASSTTLSEPAPSEPASAGASPADAAQVRTAASGAAAASTQPDDGSVGVSPRARNLAESKGLEMHGLSGSGPGGRIIERDVRKALGTSPAMTPAAIDAVKALGGRRPSAGTGIGGRITAADVAAEGTGLQGQGVVRPLISGEFPGPVREIPVQGVRKRISERMLASLQSTAQVTLNMPADARSMLAFRKRLKAANPERGLGGVNLNDIVLYAVSRTLVDFPDLNGHFLGDKILQFERVHLGLAVDTERGLMVPVVRNADLLSLKEISAEAKRLAAACLDGKVTSRELSGGTFTVTNLGSLGIEYFTPVLNTPQAAIVGVGAIAPRPLETDGEYELVPHIGLSLTFDHRAVDGAPAARFLRALADNLASFDLLLAE